jgi:hypothetical protein
MFEIALAPGGPGTGDIDLQTSAITGQTIAVATAGGSFAQVPLTLPLQRVEVLDVGEIAGLTDSPDNTATTAAIATLSYVDPDTLELRENVLVMVNRAVITGPSTLFFCPRGTTACFRSSATAPLFTIDVDGNGSPDLDENRDLQLDLLDDGTFGPATDDAVACGSGISGDAPQQVLSAELSAAELESLPSVFPRGLPVRSPSGCPFLRELVSLTRDDGAGRRPFLWHQGAPPGDADLIDIKPGSEPNAINPGSGGLVPVAILGSAELDVQHVDVTTLAFGPDGAQPAHAVGGHLEDVNGDGFADLVSHYPVKETGIAAGAAEACLRGQIGATPFEACDAVKTVPDRRASTASQVESDPPRGKGRGPRQ